MTSFLSLGILTALFIAYFLQRKRKREGRDPKSWLSIFGDTFKMPECFDTKSEALKQPVSIKANGNFDGEVVGESNYTIKIWACIPSKYEQEDQFRLYFVANLTPEDDNQHDKNAVAVKIRHSTVGYLSSSSAKTYRKWASGQEIEPLATCLCVVVKNPGKPYSIWLDLPFATS